MNAAQNVSDQNVIVIGAGICGLVLTYKLLQAGHSVQLLEAESVAGGVARTAFTEGYLLEMGPNSTLAKSAMLDLVGELGLEQNLVAPQPFAEHRFIAVDSGGRPKLCPVPKKIIDAALSPLLPLSAKLRLLAEPLRRRGGKDDEPVFEFISRRFGPQFAERIVAPMLGGIWAADIRQLSARSALGPLWQLEASHRSLVLGAAKRYFSKDSASNKTRPRILSFQSGIGELIGALSGRIQGALRLSTQVMSVKVAPGHVELECKIKAGTQKFTAARVISTLPAAATARLLQPPAADLARRISEIPYAPVGVMHLSYRREQVKHPLNGFGCLIPPYLGFNTLGVIFSSSLFPDRAPADQHLLTCFCGGARNPGAADLENPTVAEKAVSEVAGLIEAEGSPRILSRKFWSAAIPNYPPGHWKLQQECDSFNANSSRLKICGPWLRGISLNDRIETAVALAEELKN